MTSVLITGVGSEGAYGVIRSLRESVPNIHIVGLDTNANSAHKAFVDAFVVPPLRTSPDYIPFVIRQLSKFNCDVCWPIPTDELELFARERLHIERDSNARVMIGEEGSLGIANDKINLYEHLERSGIAVVAPFRVATTIEEMEGAIKAIGYPANQVVIKPARGAGSQGFRILDANLDRKKDYFRRLSLQQRTKWEDIRAVFADGDFPRMLVTEYLPGAEWDVDVLADRGKVIAAVSRKSHSMFGGMATDSEVAPNASAIDYATRIVESLKLTYIHNIAFREDSEGRLRLLEINPRVPGTIIAATKAGVNLPALALDMILGRDTSCVINTPASIRLVRYWDDVVIANC